MTIIKRIALGVLISSICFISFSIQLATAEDNATLDIGTLSDGVRHVNAVEAAQILKHNPNVKILDVRTGWEYNRGHLKDAVNLNYYSLSFKKSLRKLDKKTIWLIHCKTGVRSGRTIPLMKEAGFENIIHMDGGIDSWREAGLVVEK